MTKVDKSRYIEHALVNIMVMIVGKYLIMILKNGDSQYGHKAVLDWYNPPIYFISRVSVTGQRIQNTL